MKDELKSAYKEFGGAFVVIHGTLLNLQLFVNSWDFSPRVSIYFALNMGIPSLKYFKGMKYRKTESDEQA